MLRGSCALFCSRGLVTELEDALDELYSVDLAEFVATRKRLAQELRAAGKKDDAAALAAARKPVLSAWVLNRLARSERRDVDLLLAAGHRLRQAQSSLLRGGGRDEFANARDAQEPALARLTEAARALLEGGREGASPSVIAQVGATLRSAAVGDEGRALLARGRFEKPSTGEGFEILGGLAPPGNLPGATRAAADRRTEEIREAKAVLKEAQRTARDREREAEVAEREAGRLRLQWEEAEQRARGTKEAAEEAARAASAAGRLLEDAQGRNSSKP